MTRAFEDRATYDPAKEAVAVVSLTVECHPGQAQSVIDYVVNVRDCAGVYAVDFAHDVRIPEALPVLEIVTLAELADIALPIDTDSDINEFALGVQESLVARAEGEANAEPEIQPAGGASDALEVGDGEAVAGESAADGGAGEDGGVAGVAGEGEPGSVGGS